MLIRLVIMFIHMYFSRNIRHGEKMQATTLRDQPGDKLSNET
jgi:hypothetical protein